MDKTKLRDVIKNSVIISEAESHYLYDIKVCSFEGYFTFDKNRYLYYINAGGTTSIINKANKDYILLGCNLPLCEKMFISRGNESDE